MHPNRSDRRRRSLLFAVVLAGFGTVAHAGDWRWTVTPYAWATDVGVDVELVDRQLVDETISIAELLEDVETIAQVRLEAQRGAHGAFIDLFDVSLADDASTIALPAGGDARVTPEMGMTLLDLGGLYDPQGDQVGLQLLYGTRILDQRAEIDAELRPAGRPAAARTFEIDETLVDGLVGLRYRRLLAARWSLELQADLSTGGTELTWSVGPTVAYAFGEGGRYAVTAGYRHLAVEFETASAVDAGMTLAGALVGLRIAF